MTAYSEHLQEEYAGLDQGRDTDAIVVTHAHIDHTDALPIAHCKLPHAPIFTATA